MAKTTDSAHITTKTLLPTAINGWEMFMQDQGRSHHTVKAFYLTCGCSPNSSPQTKPSERSQLMT